MIYDINILPFIIMFTHDELNSLQAKCLSIYGEEGPQGADAFKECRTLVDQWIQKAREEMLMYTQMRGMHLGPQTYSQSTGKAIRHGTNILTRMDDTARKEAFDSLEYARSLRGDMVCLCWERLGLDLDAL